MHRPPNLSEVRKAVLTFLLSAWSQRERTLCTGASVLPNSFSFGGQSGKDSESESEEEEIKERRSCGCRSLKQREGPLPKATKARKMKIIEISWMVSVLRLLQVKAKGPRLT